MKKIAYFYPTLSIDNSFSPTIEVAVPQRGNLSIDITLFASAIIDEDDPGKIRYEVMLNNDILISSENFKNVHRNRLEDGNYSVNAIFKFTIDHIEKNQKSIFNFKIFKGKEMLDESETYMLYI